VLIVNNDNDTWGTGGIYKGDWITAAYVSGDMFKPETFNTTYFENGRYTAWIKVTDDLGHSTMKKFDFEVLVGAPVIRFPDFNNYDIVSNFSENLSIRASVQARDGYKTNGVQMRMLNETEDVVLDWLEMSNIPASTDFWINNSINLVDYGEGTYNIEVRAEDSEAIGTSTLILDFLNNRPVIEILKPTEGEVIDVLYNYDINASIHDIEGDPFDNVSIMVYNSTGASQFLEWQNMSDQGGGLWNYSIDPIDYTNEAWYTISIRAKDPAGFGNTNVSIYFQRLAPQVEFDSYEYNIFDWDALEVISFNVTQGLPSISNFTYEISSSLFGGVIYVNESFDAQFGVSNYNLTIEPRDLPNGEVILKLKCYNLTNHEFQFSAVHLSVNYFVDEQSYYEYGTFDYDSNKQVETNSYTEGELSIQYYPYLAYNYRFNEPSSLEDLKFAAFPDYRIFRSGESKYYRPLSGETGLAFEFDNKPYGSQDFLTFNAKSPTLESTSVAGEAEYGTLANGLNYLTIEVILTSELDFDNVLCKFQPDIGIRDSDSYSYSLYILQGINYIKSDIEVSFTGDFFEEMWSWEYSDVIAGQDVYFKIYGIYAPGEEFDLAPLLYAGIIAFVFMLIGWVVIGKSVFKDKWIFKRMDNKIFYIVGGVITAGVFALSYVLMAVFGSIVPYAVFL